MTNDTNSARSMICDPFKSSMSIPLEVGREREARDYLISNKIAIRPSSEHDCMRNVSATSNGIHTCSLQQKNACNRRRFLSTRLKFLLENYFMKSASKNTKTSTLWTVAVIAIYFLYTRDAEVCQIFQACGLIRFARGRHFLSAFTARDSSHSSVVGPREKRMVPFALSGLPVKAKTT